MKKEISKIVVSNFILLCMMLPSSKILAQLWSVKLVNPGKFEVNITPPDILEDVMINVSLTNPNGQVTIQDLPFTNEDTRYLKPGNTYSKSFRCDNSVKQVSGNSLSYSPSGGGDKADMARVQIRQASTSDIKSSGTVRLQGEPHNTRVRDHRRKLENENIRVRDHRRNRPNENVQVRDHRRNRPNEDVQVRQLHPEVKDIQLANTESYSFLQKVKGKYTGGDFYLADNATKFYANNEGQRGLIDLGDIGQVSLKNVSIPTDSGYNSSIPVFLGHTYVALAREEGHFIVFRVNQIINDSVMLSYFYQ